MEERASVVTGELGFLVPPNEKPFNYMYEPPAGQVRENCKFERCRVQIRNARLAPSAHGLEQCGFELLWQPSQVQHFNDPDQVRTEYYSELASLALELTGGLRAIVFDHQYREREKGRPPLGIGRPGDGSRPTALGRVHNDYTEASGPRRMRQVAEPADVDRPFVILNFWRPVLDPALDTPLALCDGRSFAREQLVATDIIYPDRTGEIYFGCHSPKQDWYYYPGMTPEELLVFKSFDSRRDCPVRLTPHCAFDDPTAPPDAPLRKSIEARCLVILD